MSMQLTPETGMIPEFNVGDRLRKARESVNLGVADFGQQIGLTRRTIARYEHGEAKPPRSLLLLWQMRTGVPAEWIETGCTPWDLNPEPTASGIILDLFSRQVVAA